MKNITLTLDQALLVLRLIDAQEEHLAVAAGGGWGRSVEQEVQTIVELSHDIEAQLSEARKAAARDIHTDQLAKQLLALDKEFISLLDADDIPEVEMRREAIAEEGKRLFATLQGRRGVDGALDCDDGDC